MISLYIHIPFCERKCFYCSFAVSVGQTHRMDAYLDCLAREARRYQGTQVQTVYVGGGTPTSMDGRCLRRLFGVIRGHFCFSPGAEWTVEANPEGLDRAKLALLKEAGVNRISLGIQSLNDGYLKYLGRNHDAAAAAGAFRRIREAGFGNVNVDVMFAFPGQTMGELEKDVAAMIRLGADHVSLYALTVEEHSRFYARSIRPPDSRYQAQQYALACEALETAGFDQYEVSNFAKPAKASRHNLNYWQGGHYIGLGVAAHSYIGTKRFWNKARFRDYVSCAQAGLPVQEGFEELTPRDRMKEMILFGLRMNRGVDMGRVEKRFGCLMGEERQKKIDRFIQGGFLIRENNYVKASPRGRLVLDELCAQLV